MDLKNADDFLFFGAPNTDEGQKALDIVLQVLAWLGVPVASHKTEGPATAITYLGKLIDTESFELRLVDEEILHKERPGITVGAPVSRSIYHTARSHILPSAIQPTPGHKGSEPLHLP